MNYGNVVLNTFLKLYIMLCAYKLAIVSLPFALSLKTIDVINHSLMILPDAS